MDGVLKDELDDLEKIDPLFLASATADPKSSNVQSTANSKINALLI